MKYLFPLLLLPLPGYCQQDVATNTHEQLVYVGINKAVEVSVPGYSCEDLDVSTGNGLVAATDNACKYELQADREGVATVTIRSAENNEVLKTIHFHALYLPDPVRTVAGKTGGNIAAKVLAVQRGIVTTWNRTSDIRFVVTSFTTTVISKGQTVVTQKSNGAYFPEELRQTFSTLQPGDKVLFSDIRAVGSDKRGRTLQPMEFVVD